MLNETTEIDRFQESVTDIILSETITETEITTTPVTTELTTSNTMFLQKNLNELEGTDATQFIIICLIIAVLFSLVVRFRRRY